MTQVGQCPHCRAVNSYEVAQCLDCRQPLPWAGTVEKYVAQMEKARGAVQQLQAQVQQLQQAQQAPRAPFASASPQGVPGATGMPGAVEDPQWTGGNRFRDYTAAMLGERAATLFDEVGEDRARIAAFLLAGLWNLCVLLGTWLILRNLTALMGSLVSAFLPSAGAGLSPSGGFPGLTPSTPAAPDLSFSAIMKILAVATFAWGVLVGLCAAVRAIGRGEGSFAGDLFIAGVALLPAGLFWVLTGVVGLGNYSFVGLLWIVATCYVVVAAYRGLVSVSKVPSAVAALCVPLMFLLEGALLKVVVTRLLSP